MNYNLITGDQVAGQDESQDNIFKAIDFCSIPRARAGMMEITPIPSVTYFRKTFFTHAAQLRANRNDHS